MLTEQTGCLHIVGVMQLRMSYTWYMNVQPLRQQYAALFTADTDTMRSFFAQQDHMQVFNFILDCLDFLNI